jgi:hypothetical protein
MNFYRANNLNHELYSKNNQILAVDNNNYGNNLNLLRNFYGKRNLKSEITNNTNNNTYFTSSSSNSSNTANSSQNTTTSTTKLLKYTYISIDSKNRDKEPTFTYSDPYYLRSNLIFLTKNSNTVYVKCGSEFLNVIKEGDYITLENLKPYTIENSANELLYQECNYIYINNNNFSGIDFDENETYNYYCTIEFDDYSINKIMFKTNNRIYFKISNDECEFYYNLIKNKYNIILKFHFQDNVPFYLINSGIPTNFYKMNNYHKILKTSKEGFYFNISISSIADDVIDSLNVKLKKILTISEYYPESNNYKISLNEYYNGITDINIVSSEFPAILNNITSNNNHLYFQVYPNTIIYDISLDEGYYTDEKLEKKIKEKMEKILNNEYTCEVSIDECLNLFSIKIWKIIDINSLIIKEIYFKNDNFFMKIENYSQLVDLENIDGDFYMVIDFNEFYEDNYKNNDVSFKSKYSYFKVYFKNLLFNKLDKEGNNIYENYKPYVFVDSSQLLNEKITVNEKSNIMFKANFLKDITKIYKEQDNITSSQTNVKINIPQKFRLCFNYNNTFSELIGFGKSKNDNITIYDYEITNKSNLINQQNNNTNRVNLKVNTYILCCCEEVKNIKSLIKFNDDSKNRNTSNAFFKIQIYKPYVNDTYVYNSYVKIKNFRHSDINNLNSLHFYFYDQNGNLVDFKNLEHSFTIEIIQEL